MFTACLQSYGSWYTHKNLNFLPTISCNNASVMQTVVNRNRPTIYVVLVCVHGLSAELRVLVCTQKFKLFCLLFHNNASVMQTVVVREDGM